MTRCLSCRDDAKRNGGDVESWQFQTIAEPCDICGSEVSHERIH